MEDINEMYSSLFFFKKILAHRQKWWYWRDLYLLLKSLISRVLFI